MKLSRILYRKAPLLLLFIISEKLHAQLCTGTISDPAVVINFGSISPLTTALPQVPAPYQIINSACPDEGYYSVRGRTFQCFNNLWQVLPSDHTTGDVDGNFLLINALPGPSDIYIDTIRGLCSGRSFQFGIWISNIVNPFQCSGPGATPNLTFSIFSLAGALLGTYTTGDIVPYQPAGWINHKFQFNIPSGNGDVILKITDVSPAGCGNDFAIDDISFSSCGGNIAAAFSNTFAQQISVCEESQVNYLLTSSYTGYTNPSLQWQISYDGINFSDIPGETNATFLRTPTTIANGVTYYYRFLLFDNGSATCKFNSNAVKIELNRSPFAQGTNYVFGCYGSTVLLGAAGGSYYHWTGPNGFESDEENPSIPSVEFSDAGRYIVKVTTSLGCFAYDTTDLTIYMAPVASVSFAEHAMCEGLSVQLSANPSYRYKWTPSEGLSDDTIVNPIANPSKTTTYTVKVYNETITCYDTASVKIIVWAKPTANAGPDKFTYSQKPVLLEGSATGTGISYSWTPQAWLNNPFAIRPYATPLHTTTYTLTVKSDYGCGIDTDGVEVKVIDSLLIPTGFTPNNDGLNDVWEIITFEKYPDATIDVYNRWGQKIYHSTGINYHPWDGNFEGQPALPGTYVYYIRLNKKAGVLKGILTVIR